MPITLRPKNERRLNVYFCHIRTGLAINVLVYPTPARMKSVFLNDDIWRFDILVEGKDCPPVEIYMRVQWGETWDKPNAKLITEDYVE